MSYKDLFCLGELEFWRESGNIGNGGRCCFFFTVFVVFFIFIHHLYYNHAFARRRSPSFTTTDSGDTESLLLHTDELITSSSPRPRELEIISNSDLCNLISNLEEESIQNEIWHSVIEKRNDSVSYSAQCCKPKDAPIKFRSVTIFRNCSVELLTDFYLDNEYRKVWDKMLVDHEHIETAEDTGIEFGRSIKKLPFLSLRDYVLAWRVWKGDDGTIYCLTKVCDHPLAPERKNCYRIRYFLCGWQVSKVPGSDSCEMKLFHQEDAGLPSEMVKIAFARGIWSYICKMDVALRQYDSTSYLCPSLARSALRFIQKVPLEVEIMRQQILSSRTSNPVLMFDSSRTLPSSSILRLLLIGGGIIMTSALVRCFINGSLRRGTS